MCWVSEERPGTGHWARLRARHCPRGGRLSHCIVGAPGVRAGPRLHTALQADATPGNARQLGSPGGQLEPSAAEFLGQERAPGRTELYDGRGGELWAPQEHGHLCPAPVEPRPPLRQGGAAGRSESTADRAALCPPRLAHGPHLPAFMLGVARRPPLPALGTWVAPPGLRPSPAPGLTAAAWGGGPSWGGGPTTLPWCQVRVEGFGADGQQH